MVNKTTKLYADKAWLWWAYHDQKLTPEEIAKLTGGGTSTVYRYLKKYKII